MDERASASEWQRKGATLSDKTARKEFGLTQDEIVQAIRVGELHYRLNSVFGHLISVAQREQMTRMPPPGALSTQSWS